ncbi:MAG: SRPBCC family protein [Jatrophihabitantaceae bacterium]
MQLEHSFTVPVGVDEAWRVLLDIERIAPCMPGAAIDSVDGDDFTGSVKVKLGPIGLTYKGKASFIEKDELAHRAVIDARGRDARGNGTASAKVTATLTETDGSTKVDVRTELDITGKPAQFGRGVMVDVGNKLIGQFADCLAGKLTEGDAAPADAATAEASGGASGSAAGTDGAASSAAASSAAASSAEASTEAASAEAAAKHRPRPGSSATTEPDAGAPGSDAPAVAAAPKPKPRIVPAADVEPINLIESAGPAIAKRLAPVALALVVLLIVFGRRKR